MNGQTVVFRVDANPAIGSGHLVRCIRLGERLRHRGCAVTFITQNVSNSLSGLLLNFAVATISRNPAWADDVALQGRYAGLSTSQHCDATETARLLRCRPDLIVVDNYDLGIQWEEAIQGYCRRLVVIDDLARPHDCDLLVDPNWHAEHTRSRYEGRVTMHARTLLGPDFAFVDPEFVHYRASPVNRLRPPKRVLVYFGGTDSFGLSALALNVLSSAEFNQLHVDVVIGATAGTGDVIRQFAAQCARVTVYEPQPTLAPLLAQADLSIGAVGGTTWERMCLGVPTMAAIVADNQCEAARRLSEAGLLYLLGPAAEVAEETLARGVRTLLGDPALRQRMADAGQALVDGRGIDRIVDAMAALS